MRDIYSTDIQFVDNSSEIIMVSVTGMKAKRCTLKNDAFFVVTIVN